MFGLNLEADGWAAVAAGAVLLARVSYSVGKQFREWATDAEPGGSFDMLGILVSGMALAVLAVAATSLLSGGLAKPARYALYVGLGFVNFIAGMFLDVAFNLRLARFVNRLRAFRVPRYRELLVDPDPEKQLFAVKRLFYVGPGAAPAVPELLAASKGESNELRTYALLALWRIESDDPDVRKAAQSALFDPDLKVRAAAAVALVRLKHPAEDLLAPLCDGLACHTHQIAVSSQEALADLGPAAAPAVPAIRALALAVNYPQNSGAVMLLGKVGADGVPVLIEVLETGNKHARSEAILVLGEMGEAARPAFPALRLAAKDSDLMIRTSAEGALRRLGATVG